MHACGRALLIALCASAALLERPCTFVSATRNSRVVGTPRVPAWGLDEPAERPHTADLEQLRSHLLSALQPSKKCFVKSGAAKKACRLEGARCARPFNEDLFAVATSKPRGVSGRPCKLLWFAGFHMGDSSDCSDRSPGSYRRQYAAALQTLRAHTTTVIQPVLVLLWQGVPAAERHKADGLTSWAQSQGAVVISVEDLSFKALMRARNMTDGMLGVFLRLDFPALARRHRLFNLPNVCPRAMMYTDVDVVFKSRIDAEDVRKLLSFVDPGGRAIMAYGAEHVPDASESTNTGVMVIDVPRYLREWPSILKFGLDSLPFFDSDQGWFNAYFHRPGFAGKLTALPLEWNWKLYWPAPRERWARVKIVHTHGPKLDMGLKEVAQCNNHGSQQLPGSLPVLARWAICCNHGSVAHYLMRVYRMTKAASVVCT